MKSIFRSTFFPSFLILALWFLPVVHAGEIASPAAQADDPGGIIDMIPYESIGYVSLSNLEAVYYSVEGSPEWQELLGIEQIQEDLDKAKQAVLFGPMLLGITLEEFLNSFGHRMVLGLMGMKDSMPIVGLAADLRSHKEKAQYAVDQAATFPAVAGGAMLEEKEYRDVPCTAVGNEAFKVKYAFLDNFLIAGFNGGFEKMIDHYKDGGKSIRDKANFQFMKQKVSLSGDICAYADLESLVPILNATSDKEEQSGNAIQQLALKSMKGFALSLSLSGQTQEAYMHLKSEEPNPIADLVLSPHSPMSTANLIPFPDGAMIGIHVGDPVVLLDRGFKLAESLGVNTNEIEGNIKQLEDGLRVNLRDDLLSALTGEIAIIAILPKEPVDLKKDKVQAAMQLAKIRLAAFIGVKDEKKLGKTAEKLLKLVNIEPVSLKEKSHEGSKIHTKALPLDALVPGVAIMPSYSFKDGLLIVSNSAEWVKDGISMLESQRVSEMQDEFSDSRVLAYVDAAGIANFAIENDMIESLKVPELAQDKLSSLGSVAVGFSLGSDGAGLRLISTSDDNWTTKILRGVLVAIYANARPEQEATETEDTSAGEGEAPAEP
jgi:hypothetical protein